MAIKMRYSSVYTTVVFLFIVIRHVSYTREIEYHTHAARLHDMFRKLMKVLQVIAALCVCV
jgi:hypothetical protein